jgi:hypothetical protein
VQLPDVSADVSLPKVKGGKLDVKVDVPDLKVKGKVRHPALAAAAGRAMHVCRCWPAGREQAMPCCPLPDRVAHLPTAVFCLLSACSLCAAARRVC